MFQLNLSKAINMTKMQVTARCVVVLLGIYCINVTLGSVNVLLMLLADTISIKTGSIILACSYFFFGLVVYFALFRDRGFSYHLAGPLEPGETLVEMPDFVNALRITVVFTGLILIPGALQYIVYLAKLPAMSRALLFAAFGSERFSHQLPQRIRDIATVLTSLVRLCLVTYLIIGAPAYVGWQVRKSSARKITSENSSSRSGDRI